PRLSDRRHGWCDMSTLELPITGYLDRFSHRPGESFAVYVSLRDGGSYRAHLVRVVCADPTRPDQACGWTICRGCSTAAWRGGISRSGWVPTASCRRDRCETHARPAPGACWFGRACWTRAVRCWPNRT